MIYDPYLDEKDNFGYTSPESVKNRLLECEQGNLEPTNRNSTLSNMNTSNGNADTNIEPDFLVLTQQGNPLDVLTPSCLTSNPPYVSGETEEDNLNHSTTSGIYGSENDADISHYIQLNMRDYTEASMFNSHQENEVRSSASINSASRGESKERRDVSNAYALSNDYAGLPQLFENSENGVFFNPRNILPTMHEHGISIEQCDGHLQIISQSYLEPQDQKLSTYKSYNNNSEERSKRGLETLVNVDNNSAVAGPSTSNPEPILQLGRPFVCAECRRGFHRQGHLEEHIRTHTGEKPYACEFCQRRFRKASHLVYHIGTHTGERHHECSICEERFKDKRNLNKHYKNIHNLK